MKWWNGKTIAIVGATASGKNSFYDCLLEKDPPKEHIQTRGVEKVHSFTVKRNIQGLGTIELRCKRSVNVGGEVDEQIGGLKLVTMQISFFIWWIWNA